MLRGLYLITPDWLDTARLLHACEQAMSAGAACLQYRNKAADAALRLSQAQALAALCQTCHIPLIINDDAGLARQVGAAGVHLGRTDGNIAQARQLLGGNALIGVSCYKDLALAEQAVRAGASYIAFGAMYPSSTKPTAEQAPVDILSRARQQFPGLPIACIGGITADNAAPLLAAGADLLAVISDVFAAPDVAHAARRYRALFAQAPN